MMDDTADCASLPTHVVWVDFTSPGLNVAWAHWDAGDSHIVYHFIAYMKYRQLNSIHASIQNSFYTVKE